MPHSDAARERLNAGNTTEKHCKGFKSGRSRRVQFRRLNPVMDGVRLSGFEYLQVKVLGTLQAASSAFTSPPWASPMLSTIHKPSRPREMQSSQLSFIFQHFISENRPSTQRESDELSCEVDGKSCTLPLPSHPSLFLSSPLHLTRPWQRRSFISLGRIKRVGEGLSRWTPLWTSTG